jgi:hypothetical protein
LYKALFSKIGTSIDVFYFLKDSPLFGLNIDGPNEGICEGKIAGRCFGNNGIHQKQKLKVFFFSISMLV